MKIPLLYSAVASSDVKLLKISVTDFQTRFPVEIQQIMETKTMEKLEWIKQRLETCHKIRKEISKMDLQTETYEQTINHIKSIYPLSNKQAQINIRKAVME